MDKAYDLYVEACVRAPAEPEVWRERGSVAFLLGDLEEASACLFKSADIFARMARLEPAIEIMALVLRLDPDRADARRFDRFLRRRMGALGDARGEVQREVSSEESACAAGDVEPDDAEVAAALSVLDVETGAGALGCTALHVADVGRDFREPHHGEVADDGAARVAGDEPAGVPLAHAQAVLRAVLAAGLLPTMRSDQMRCLFDLGRVVELVAGTREAAQPVEDHACLVVDGVVSLDRPAPGAKTLYSLGELFGAREVVAGASMSCVSATALVLAIPCDMLAEITAGAPSARSSAA